MSKKQPELKKDKEAEKPLAKIEKQKRQTIILYMQNT